MANIYTTSGKAIAIASGPLTIINHVQIRGSEDKILGRVHITVDLKECPEEFHVMVINYLMRTSAELNLCPAELKQPTPTTKLAWWDPRGWF